VARIRQFQHKHNLEQDGIVGPSTYRRLLTEKQANQIEQSKHIICNNSKIPIDWDKVITFNDIGGYVAPKGSFKQAERTNINMFVVHFDVCLSSKSCFDVLKQRNLSVHFLIDNDGTIYQTLDTKHIAWHASGVNYASVGVEISNAFYKKFQSTYEKMGFGPRPLINDSIVHGKRLEEHLGFYDVQIKALKALCKSLNNGAGIQLKTPSKSIPRFTVVEEAENGIYQGVVHHYQITTNKIDSAGLDLQKVLKDL